MENIRKGEIRYQDPKYNNSYLIYNTIYTNKLHEKDHLISWTSSKIHSAALYYENSTNSIILEILKNNISLQTETVDFFLQHRIRLKHNTLPYNSQVNDDINIDMYFISEHFILIEVSYQATIMIDYLTGKYVPIGIKVQSNKNSKPEPLKILYSYDEYYNHIDNTNMSNLIDKNNYRNNDNNTLYKETEDGNASTLSVHSTLNTNTNRTNNRIKKEILTTSAPPPFQLTNSQTSNKTYRRTYLFLIHKNILYYTLIDHTYTLNKQLAFKQAVFPLENNIAQSSRTEDEIIQMNIITLNQNNDHSYIFFLLSRKYLSIFPTNFNKNSLKLNLRVNNFNQLNTFKLRFKFELGYETSSLFSNHLIVKYKHEASSSPIYILNGFYLITIHIDWYNLQTIAKKLNDEILTINKTTIKSNKQLIPLKITKLNENLSTCTINEIIEHKGNIILYNKTNKTLEIYYMNGIYNEKVTNYCHLNIIKFITFPKMNYLFFAMNNTVNKICFNKNLYWYNEKWKSEESIKVSHRKPFELIKLKEVFISIQNNYTKNDDNKMICSLCGIKLTKGNNTNKNSNRTTSRYTACSLCGITKYCCEEHKQIDYYKFHFFDCKLKRLFTKYTYENQFDFYNKLMYVIIDILEEIFNNINSNDSYLFYMSYIKLLTQLMQCVGIKQISDNVFEQSSKSNGMDHSDIKKLLFYQEVTFFYYNLVLLYLNFALKGGMYNFVEKEIECLGSEYMFNKQFFLSTTFKKESNINTNTIIVNAVNSQIDFSQLLSSTKIQFDLEHDNFFFLDSEYASVINYLKQNDILLSETIHVYANFIHLIDALRKVNVMSNLNLMTFDFKLKNQLLVLFEDRGMDKVSNYFYAYIVPYICINKKMNVAEKFLKKVENAISNENSANNNIIVINNIGDTNNNNHNTSYPNHNQISIFNVVIHHNLGLIQFSIGKFLDGIHNIEIAYKLIYDFQFSYPLRILIVERLALAYLNIRELLKSYHLIKEALSLRSLLHSSENQIQIIYLNSYLNYIQDFVEYEHKISSQEEKEKTLQNKTYRDYQMYIINYVLTRNDSRRNSFIDLYTKDYFRAAGFIYHRTKDILAKLNNDNQSKKSTAVVNNKDDISIIHNSIINLGSNISSNTIHESSPNAEKQKMLFGQSDYSVFSAMNTFKESTEKEEILEYENEIDIKESVFDQLSRNDQLTLTSINSHYFTRNNILRDYYGQINAFNINYHPVYTIEFKNILESSKHQFFLRKLTHAQSVEIENYFDEEQCLFGLSKYLQQEEIQNMFKVEKAKMLADEMKDNKGDSGNKERKKSGNVLMKIISEKDIGNMEEVDDIKQNWINNVKERLLKEKNRSIREIDKVLDELYDGLNEEYKEEIERNPEMILYYIFHDIDINMDTRVTLEDNEEESN